MSDGPHPATDSKQNASAPATGPGSGTQRDVFVSYASPDAEIASAVVRALERCGLSCWIAPRDVTAGANYAESIIQAINASRVLLLILSVHSMASKHVGREVERASSKNKSIITLRTDSAVLPAALEYFLSESQWVELGAEGADEAVAKIVPAVQGQLAPPAAVAGRPAPAREGGRRKGRARAKLLTLLAAAACVFAGIALLTAKNPRPAANAPSLPPAAAQPSLNAVTAAAAIPEKSVAVLPFVDLSEKHDQDYFSDGLTDELIEQLGRVPGLHVPARTSSFYFKGKAATIAEVGKALGVAHVLEGSVRRSGNTVRITAELIDVPSDSHAWSQTFDRQLDDIFKIQDEIAAAVVQQLKVALSGTPSQLGATRNSQAYTLYLQARHACGHETVEDLNRGVSLFEQAITLDPNYALAYAWLADCHGRRVGNGLDTDGVGYAKARAAAERAMALEPSLPDGYVKLGMARMQYGLDWATASAMAKKALALDPNNPQALELSGHIAVAVGTLADAESDFRRAIEQDPLNLQYRRYLGRALYYDNRLPEAEAALRRILDLDPDATVAHYELGRVLLARGDLPGALAAFKAETGNAWGLFGLPLVYSALKRADDSQAALQALLAQSAGAEFQVAETYAYLGQAQLAFEWLDNARTRHDPGVVWVRGDPLLRSIVKDPRFARFLRSVNLPD
jgi:TolB-like protein